MSKVYYMLSRRGTKKPTPEQLKDQERVKNNAGQIFGFSYTDEKTLVATGRFDNMKGGQKYSLFLVGEDLAGNLGTSVTKRNFKTKQSHYPCMITVFTTTVVSCE
jgi:hypothetical protein